MSTSTPRQRPRVPRPPIAIVGYAGYTYGLELKVPDPQRIIDIDGKYFVYFGVDRDLLWKTGCHLSH